MDVEQLIAELAALALLVLLLSCRKRLKLLHQTQIRYKAAADRWLTKMPSTSSQEKLPPSPVPNTDLSKSSDSELQ